MGSGSPPPTHCLCRRGSLSMLAFPELIQSWLTGPTGDGRTMVPVRERMGNQLFSLVFSPDPLRTRLSAFALPFHSPSSPKLCGLFVVFRLPVPHPASRQSATASWSGCNNLGFVSGTLTARKEPAVGKAWLLLLSKLKIQEKY